jgi:hypothetical protein
MQTHLVLTQLQLQERAVSRFRRARQMYWTNRSLQQATDDVVAAYKAGRFPEGEAVIDLCCGIGGDLLALAQRGPVLGVDSDPVLACLAAENLRQQSAHNGWVGCGDACQLSVLPQVAVHLDPDRRSGERRSVTLSLHRPGPALMARLAAHPTGLALKLSPAADASEPLLAAAELEWIGHHRQCHQLVAWFGPLARNPQQRVATVLDAQGQAHRLTATELPSLLQTADVGRVLVEPQPCVLAAGLAAVVAERHRLCALTAGGGYLTGDDGVTDAWATCFQVLDVIPFRLKRVQAWLKQRGIGRVEIKKRGVSIDPAQLLRVLRPKGDECATVILASLGRRTVAILARRLVADRETSYDYGSVTIGDNPMISSGPSAPPSP